MMTEIREQARKWGSQYHSCAASIVATKSFRQASKCARKSAGDKVDKKNGFGLHGVLSAVPTKPPIAPEMKSLRSWAVLLCAWGGVREGFENKG
jgi:hypothetical protein